MTQSLSLKFNDKSSLEHNCQSSCNLCGYKCDGSCCDMNLSSILCGFFQTRVDALNIDSSKIFRDQSLESRNFSEPSRISHLVLNVIVFVFVA